MRRIKKIAKTSQRGAKADHAVATAPAYKWGDIRDTTRRTRVKIGFPPTKDKWKTAEAHFTKNKLRILGHPVMESWETPYMQQLAQIACSNGGVVLEVGFGMGISAGFIQECEIQRHIIIEMNSDVAARARAFGKKAKHPVSVLDGLWEDVIGTIPNNSLDGILFDTYPLSEPEIHKNHFFFFPSAYKKLKRGGIFTYYSDEISAYRPEHLKRLIEAGFKKSLIDYRIIPVQPPADCRYWKSRTILAPIIKKG